MSLQLSRSFVQAALATEVVFLSLPSHEGENTGCVFGFLGVDKGKDLMDTSHPDLRLGIGDQLRLSMTHHEFQQEEGCGTLFRDKEGERCSLSIVSCPLQALSGGNGSNVG